MPVYVSLLRAVNVGGRGAIRMAPLAEAYREHGFENVTTVLQSGNVVFSTGPRDPAQIARTIGDAIEERFGFRPVVIVRTAAALRRAIAGNPFGGRSDVAPARLVAMFLETVPDRNGERALAAAHRGPEEVHVSGGEVFVHYVNGIGRSKLTGAAIERALGVMGTARNWNTVTKLAEAAHQ